MATPLNEWLYNRLVAVFGRVRVENEGVEAGDVRLDPITLRPRRYSGSGSEEYIVCCPFCGDTKGHLYLNYRYGVDDPDTYSDNVHLAHCFHFNCVADEDHRRQLCEWILQGRRIPAKRRDLKKILARPLNPKPVSVTVAPPGTLVALLDLPEHHVARRYLCSRGFDLAELAARWEISCCVHSWYLTAMTNRVYIPLFQRKQFVGWQGRYPGEGVEPKYYNMPGLRKSELLYNRDQARETPLIVVAEGVTDVWRIGVSAVGIFGKKASQTQLLQLAEVSQNKPLVVCLDAAAAAENLQLYQILKQLHQGPTVLVTLPAGKDPGSLERPEVWRIIHTAAADQKITLPLGAGEAVRL